MIEPLIANLKRGADGIYDVAPENLAQQKEAAFRESVTDLPLDFDYLTEIGRNHSIAVMDREVRRFTALLPQNARIVDVGGCWGWHWRNLSESRPDIKVFIVDFVRSNLSRARIVLGSKIDNSIFLVHGDAISLEFPDSVFDGYWTVQTIQHIPDFNGALSEARRVLKVGGHFANYSLNVQPLMRAISKFGGKPYVVEGQFGEHLFLRRAQARHSELISNCFNAIVKRRFSEFIFQPNLRTTFTGLEQSKLGKLDSLLSCSSPLLGSLARQQSFHCVAGPRMTKTQ